MKAQLADITLAYEEAGSGNPVILIHGFPLNRRMWTPQVAALAGAGYRVITPDLRGFGESDAPAQGYSMDRFADDVAALMDRLEVRSAAVGGMSMGGYVLFNLLARHPQRVSAAMFMVTRCGADDAAGRARRTALAEDARSGRARLVADAFGEVLFAPQTPEENPALVARVKTWMEETDPRGLAGGLLAMRDRADYTDQLGSIRTASLVVGAELDRTIAPEQSRIIAAGIPGAQRCLIARAGHMANLERPEAVNACLVDFLKGLRW